MCLGYRHVNGQLASDIYSLPRLDELVEKAPGHNYYVILDMPEDYFQISNNPYSPPFDESGLRFFFFFFILPISPVGYLGGLMEDPAR